MANRNYGKPSYHRSFRLRRVRTTPVITLGALANITVVEGALTPVGVAAYRAISHSCIWSRKGAASGEGPVLVGYAHSDYTATEVKECLESQASIDIGNKTSQEQANRLVRIVGAFAGIALSGGDEVLNDGKPIKTRLNWLIPIGDTVDIFAYNETGSTLTTGGLIEADGDLWVKDGV